MRKLLPVLFLPACLALGQHPEQTPAYNPKVAPASNEGELALKRIRVPPGLKLDLFAAEPLLANPVAFSIDEKGRFFVAETFRLHAGVTDIRGHMNWLDDDLACRTVADRLAMYRKYLGKQFDSYAVDHDRVRLVVDSDGDGKADKATVFADGFNRHEDGIGAGVLARKSEVWYTCIPDLWLLKDTDGDGKADVRKKLSSGYGVHVGFIGHDLHGLRMGPDGKLYFSLGDRGLNVTGIDGRRVISPDAGAVMRCNPDGSDLELFATGLRNPQELTFDQYGNLFTGDNNSDGGDKARWVYVVEGGDSGWRIGYQFINQPASRGPWNQERMWHPAWAGQPAAIVPPIANLADGPSGVTYYPGVGLPERYNEHFFLADFRGASGNSGIRSFAVKPKGASFELVDQHEFVWSILATDVEFGPDCALYISDWVEGWGMPKKGRIYKVTDPQQYAGATAIEVKKLLADGLDRLPSERLIALLEHRHMEVRQEAQFALAARKKEGLAPFSSVALKGKERLPRLHAVWGLGQIGRSEAAAFQELLPLLKDADAEVRAQAAKILGDGKEKLAFDGLVKLLAEDEPRVRFFAATALGKLGRKEACEPVLAMLKDNADKDAYLRHAGVMALTGINDPAALERAARDGSPAVRLAALLTWRRLGSPEVVRFLDDATPRLAIESARAINDVPIVAGFERLAALIDGSPGSERRLHEWRLAGKTPTQGEPRAALEPLLYRALNANFRLGKPPHAAAVAAFAARSDMSEGLRIEAIRLLGEWQNPSGRDKLVGLWRPLAPRPVDVGATAFRNQLAGIFAGPDKLRQEAAKVAGALGIKEVGPMLLQLVKDRGGSSGARVEALAALARIKGTEVDAAIESALKDDEPALHREARRVLVGKDPSRAFKLTEKVLKEGETLPETVSASTKRQADIAARQSAFSVLAALKNPEADALLSTWFDKLLAGSVEPEVQLDLLEAARVSLSSELKGKLKKYESARPKNDLVALFRESLHGGDAERGRAIFVAKPEVFCFRCHKVNGEGGEVGPDLSGIGLQQKREYILEGVVAPNKQIAKGFETVIITTTNGKIVTGIVKSEDKDNLRLITPEGQMVTVPVKDIDDRQAGKSAMPDDVTKYLSRSEVRDLVEFLANLKKPAAQK